MNAIDELFKACNDPILIADLNGKVLWRNQAATGALGGHLTLATLLEASVAQQIVETTQVKIVEVNLKLASDQTIRQTLFVTALGTGDPDGERLLIIAKAVISDARTVAEREELLSSVAHDLKNPLGAIFGYADALLDTALASDLNTGHRSVLSRIRSTASRSIDLVRNYQHLSQIVSGKYREASPLVDLNEAVRNVVENTWREDQSVPGVLLSLAPNVLQVRADKMSIDRLLGNLFTNALKFAEPHTTIAIRTARDNNSAVFEINNRGPIISASEITTIFERYTRAAATAHISGSGLGLYIVRAIVATLEGDIAVQSNVESGTTFTVKLPLVGSGTVDSVSVR